MTTDWAKEETEEVKGSVIESDDEDVLIEGSIASTTSETTRYETSEGAADWFTIANLDIRKEKIKFKYITIPANKTFEVNF